MEEYSKWEKKIELFFVEIMNIFIEICFNSIFEFPFS